MTSPEDGLRVITDRYGSHRGRRALHAKGVHLTATFTATAAASKLSRAAHLRGEPVGASARFSNGGGDPTVPDYEPDVRGLAVSFHLPDGTRTDILAQTLERFPFGDEDGFFESVRASKPSASALLRLPLVALRYPRAALALPGTIRTMASLPASFATRTYKAIHAFGLVNDRGERRWVRYRWLPTIAEESIPRRAAKQAGPDYLFDELRARLERAPVRMELEAQVAEEGDDPHNPSSVWPRERDRVILGTLEVTAVDPDADDGIVFDPMRLTDGIEASDDPVLRYRPAVYTLSHGRRSS